jgi:peptidoglycan/xylan/chitin deacetylase (PgdA/CDA1 family)
MRICQCWDDGNLDDIRLTELLRKHGATASFNLNPGLMRSERYSGWKYKDTKAVWKLTKDEAPAVYQGFDIANHSLTHPHMTKIDDAQLAREIHEAKDQLEQWFGKQVPGFVYPFGDHDARVMDAVRAAGHTYARTCHNALDVMQVPDRMAQPSSRFHLAADFWDEFDRVRATDGVFYFWGHSYEFITEDDWQAFDAKLTRINATPGVQWVRLADVFAN